MERDSKLIAELKQMLDFNSHAHVERDLDHRLQQAHEIHFNSHAHVERDSYLSLAYDNIDISTHTLTWSVTLIHILMYLLRIISTHTLTWSVTGGRS